MNKFLKGKKILITAGPVWTPIDKVRIITNIFRGSLGLIIAREAVRLGGQVTLLLGTGSMPSNLLKKNINLIRFKYFEELFSLIKDEVSSKKYNIIIHCAAVSDYKPVKKYAKKISSRKKTILIKLIPNPKIVDYIKKWDPNIFLVKFKLEVGVPFKKLILIAQKSRVASNADLIVANDLLKMQNKKHEAFILDRRQKVEKTRTKKELAEKIFIIIKDKLINT